MFTIRLERKSDYKKVENLIRECFWNVYRPGCFEHFVVHKLRDEKCFERRLDYVMENKGQIIGSIFYSKGTLKSDEKEFNALTFGPVSIDKNYQHKGYGEKLINFTLDKAQEMGFSFVVITGDLNYYKKFGFELASKYKIYYSGCEGQDLPYFLIKVFNKNKIKNYHGSYSDPECFNVKSEDVEKFDISFPKKIKEKNANQIGE